MVYEISTNKQGNYFGKIRGKHTLEKQTTNKNKTKKISDVENKMKADHSKNVLSS